MTKNMYTVAGDGPCNEELALRIQAGDKNAAERLVSQNEGYLTKLARAYTPWCELEDLKQEAALALLDTADGGGADAQRAESGPELSGHRSAGRGWQDLSGAGDLSQLQRPQRSGEGGQGRAAETEKGLVRRSLWPVALRAEGHPRRQSGGGAGCGASRNAAENTVGGEKALANRFACEVAALIHVYEALGGA